MLLYFDKNKCIENPKWEFHPKGAENLEVSHNTYKNCGDSQQNWNVLSAICLGCREKEINGMIR